MGPLWLETMPQSNRKAKFYKLTPTGRRQLADERSNRERLSRAINLVLAVDVAGGERLSHAGPQIGVKRGKTDGSRV
jgi:DNA-binding PadR family transcriptional regulator